MPLRILSPKTGVADVGDTWRTTLLVTDNDGVPSDADSVVCTVSLPNFTTASATVTTDVVGIYLVSYTLAADGRYTAVLTVTSARFGNDVADLAVEAIAGGSSISAHLTEDIAAYLGTVSATADDITSALNAELAAQRAVCRIPSTYSADLRQALLRRIARNLAMRGIPLAVLQGDAEGGSMTLPGRDPEVRRLEAPWRRLKVG